MKQVKARKDQISGRVQHRRRNLAEKYGQLHGLSRATARFESPREVSVGDDRLTADRIFINVGGRAVVPEIPGLDGRSLPHQQLHDGLDFLPRHLVIVGGSYIGLEFGQMFRRFGSEVTILETGPRLIQREDQDVSDAIREILEREGSTSALNAKVYAVGKARRRDRRHRGLRRAGCGDSRLPPSARRGTASQYRRSGSGQSRRRNRCAWIHHG